MNKIVDFLRKMNWRYKIQPDQVKIDLFKQDGVGKNISWDPLVRGGTSFVTHNLIKSDGLLRYSISIYSILFSLIFIGIGGTNLLILYSAGVNANSHILSPDIMLTSIISCVFLCVGAYFLIRLRRKCWAFDKILGYCYTGKIPRNIIQTEKIIPLSQIHALQVLSEWVVAKNSFTSYEINLVLKDFSRINILDHGNIKKIREDAQDLSIFLGVPIWDVLKNA